MTPREAGAESRGLVFDIQRFSVHDGPGIRTCVFFKGCPLRCGWCCNPESQAARPEPMWSRRDGRPEVAGRWTTAEAVLETVLRDRDYYDDSGGGLTLTGGEFMAQAAFAGRLIDLAADAALHVAGETSGAIRPRVFQHLAGRLDLVLMDVKHHDPERHRDHTGGPLGQILQNAEWLAASGVPHEFRIPVVPGVNDALADADAFAELFAGMGVRRVTLLGFHQLGRGKYADLGRPYGFAAARALGPADLAAYRDRLADRGLAAQIQT
ncbi:MAG: radical SAM protein [Bifidobacteriaceae bacterium]|jgi:pyruvate formate lyase activating enzyme|nr:radical SAM protein [Bifidobacteriaceae bacterium]